MPPADVAKVIAEGRRQNQPALALHLWFAAITGSRRGELCAVQVCDLDLDRGNLHIAFNYVVCGGQRIRKDTKRSLCRMAASAQEGAAGFAGRT